MAVFAQLLYNARARAKRDLRTLGREGYVDPGSRRRKPDDRTASTCSSVVREQHVARRMRWIAILPLSIGDDGDDDDDDDDERRGEEGKGKRAVPRSCSWALYPRQPALPTRERGEALTFAPATMARCGLACGCSFACHGPMMGLPSRPVPCPLPRHSIDTATFEKRPKYTPADQKCSLSTSAACLRLTHKIRSTVLSYFFSRKLDVYC